MTAKLIEPGATGEPAHEILIPSDEFLIGRGSDCDLRLRDINISRHHCLIRVRPGEVTLTDLGSSNGTYVNGQRVVSQAAIKSGDELRIGEFRYFLDLGEGNTKLERNVPNVDPLAMMRKLNLPDKKNKPPSS